jgi:hypothetical protein
MREFLDYHSAIITFFVLASPFFFFGYGGVFYVWRRIRRSTETAQAEVFKIEEDKSGEEISYRTWARFRWKDEVYQVADCWGQTPKLHVVGKEVTVYFPPQHPELAMISRWRRALPFFFIGSLGAAGMLAGIYITN